MIVTRIQSEHGSHIEPLCNDAWDDLTKLQWHAAVASHDAQMDIAVTPANYWIGDVKQADVYNIRVGRTISCGNRFNAAWSFIAGVAAGAGAMRERAESAERDRDTNNSIARDIVGDFRRACKERDRLRLAWRSARRRALHSDARPVMGTEEPSTPPTGASGVFLGFDGSRSRDATALLICRARDGRLFYDDKTEAADERDRAIARAEKAERLAQQAERRAQTTRELWRSAAFQMEESRDKWKERAKGAAAELAKIDAILTKAGNLYPQGAAGVRDVVGQREYHLESQRTAETTLSQIRDLAYMGSQSADHIRRQILGVLEKAGLRPGVKR